jgi:hypothetical protein
MRFRLFDLKKGRLYVANHMGPGQKTGPDGADSIRSGLPAGVDDISSDSLDGAADLSHTFNDNLERAENVRRGVMAPGSSAALKPGPAYAQQRQASDGTNVADAAPLT